MIFFKNFFEKRIEIEDSGDQKVKELTKEKREPIPRESSSPPPRTPEEEILETRERSSSNPFVGGGKQKIFC